MKKEKLVEKYGGRGMIDLTFSRGEGGSESSK
jgi:hypothetical protein